MSTTNQIKRRWIAMIFDLLIKEQAARRALSLGDGSNLSQIESAGTYKRCQMLRRRFDNGERSDKLRRAMESEC